MSVLAFAAIVTLLVYFFCPCLRAKKRVKLLASPAKTLGEAFVLSSLSLAGEETFQLVVLQ